MLERALAVSRRSRPADVQEIVREVAHRLAQVQPAMGVFRRWSAEWYEAARSASGRALLGNLDRWVRSWQRILAGEPERIARWARGRIPVGARILTLSRSTSVRAVLKSSVRGRPPEQVLVLESRPGEEGRLFARELRRDGLSARCIADAQGPRIVRTVDLVLVGADAVYRDGSVVHKVGTRPLALAARRARVPVVVVAGRSKVVPLSSPPRRLPRLFDRTPLSAIREFWTDLGPVPAARWSDWVARER